MSEFSVQVTGVKELIEKLGKATAQETIEPALFRGATFIESTVVKTRLSGPRPLVLERKTGRLASSLTISRSIDRNNLTFFIGTNVEYARFHEFGFKGTIHVPAHIRRIRERVSFKRWVAGKGSFVAVEKRVSRKRNAGYSHVSAYGYMRNYAGKPFFRPVIESNVVKDKVTNFVQKAIDKALSK